MSRMFCLLLWQLLLRVSCHVAAGKNIYYFNSYWCSFSTLTADSVWSSASLCTVGSNIFASVRENSPAGQFISHISIRSDPGANTVRLCLTGPNANWFYLEGRTIRLNSSASRVLDREVRLRRPYNTVQHVWLTKVSLFLRFWVRFWSLSSPVMRTISNK